MQRCSNLEEAQERLNRNKVCPSIGYVDRTMPSLQYHSRRVDAEITFPAILQTGETLPWPDWTWFFHYEGDAWAFRVEGETGGLVETTLDLHLQRHISGILWGGVALGRVPEPGWNRPLDRFSLTLTLQ